MSMQAWMPDSLLRENESSVRDLPLVKQNYSSLKFIFVYEHLFNPRIVLISRVIFLSLFIIIYLRVGINVGIIPTINC